MYLYMFRLAWIHLSFRGVRIWRRINNRHGEMIICKYYRTGRSIRESFDVREKCDLKNNKKARMKVCNVNRVQANEFVREHERTENCSMLARDSSNYTSYCHLRQTSEMMRKKKKKNVVYILKKNVPASEHPIQPWLLLRTVCFRWFFLYD